MKIETPVRFAVIGDMHLGFDDDSLRNSEAALTDAVSLEPDLVVFSGDLVNLRDGYWHLFHQVAGILRGIPFVVARGNADYTAGGDGPWLRELPNPVREVLDLGPVRFLSIGCVTGAHEMELGPGAEDWIVENAGARAEALVVLVSHAPVKDTTFWSCDNAESGCMVEALDPSNPPYHLYLARSEEMRAALRRCPNIRLFLTGHVHNDHRLSCSHGYGPIVEQEGVIHAVTANIGGWVGFGVPRSEYRFVTISEGGILVQVRDFVSHDWVPSLESRFPLRAG